jgi:hypothetical protein
VIANSKKTVFGALRGFRRSSQGSAKNERCGLCGAGLGSRHAHLLDRAAGNIVCACGACAVLFNHRGEAGKLLRIPDEARRLPDFQMSDAEWSGFMLPIDLAFFVKQSSGANAVRAFYPSPAGNMESLLALETWEGLVNENPALSHMLPDVEALLVNRTRGHRDYLVAPIDQCYKLTGLIRLHWRGLSGGEEVWREIDTFFEQLSQGEHREERAYA